MSKKKNRFSRLKRMNENSPDRRGRVAREIKRIEERRIDAVYQQNLKENKNG